MKLSVCIPVYNFDVRGLVNSLQAEISKKNLDAEILLIDDASSQKFRAINSVLKNSVSRFVFLDKNIGRSKIRNLFSSYSSGDFLLFLDCDVAVGSPDFLSRYLEFLKQNPAAKVVYGGRVSAGRFPGKAYALRWKYAKKRENLPAEERGKNPYLSFQTNNFLVETSVFRKVHFNEDYNGYGYEDLLFSMDLKIGKYKIFHCENPVLNLDLEENWHFLEKTHEAVKSLATMLLSTENSEKLTEIKLVKAYSQLKNLKLDAVFLFTFRPVKNHLKRALASRNLPLRVLDYYKLGLLTEFLNEKNRP